MTTKPPPTADPAMVSAEVAELREKLATATAGEHPILDMIGTMTLVVMLVVMGFGGGVLFERQAGPGHCACGINPPPAAIRVVPPPGEADGCQT